MRRFWYMQFAMIAAAVLAFGTGCADNGPKMKPVYPVHGKVTYRGKPVAGVQLNFALVGSSGPDATFATGTSSADGEFVLSTYRKDDGAPAGEYVITAFWPDKRADAKKVKAAAGEELAPDRFEGAYSNPASSKLRATVQAQDNDLTIDIP